MLRYKNINNSHIYISPVQEKWNTDTTTDFFLSLCWTQGAINIFARWFPQSISVCQDVSFDEWPFMCSSNSKHVQPYVVSANTATNL
jgi:hypothetical protein